MRKDTPKYVVEIARSLRKEQTQAEERLWHRLRNRQLGGFKFRRQYAIGRYIADFYCSDARLVIEIDGPIHQTQTEYDQYRENKIMLRDIAVLRFSNYEIESDMETVLTKIQQKVLGKIVSI